MNDIILEAKKFADSEKKKYGEIPSFNAVVEKGQELAENLGAEKDIVVIGTLLMDIKLKECINEGKVAEHVEKSVEATKDFLSKFDISKDKKEKIISCVAQHHGGVEFSCLESEICCNADCYKFLIPKKVVPNIIKWTNRKMTVDEATNFALKKAEEKWNALTLDFCKKELEHNYKVIKEFLEAAN